MQLLKFFAFVLLTVSALTATAQADQYVKDGKAKLEDKDYSGALELFNKAISAEDKPEYRLERAWAYIGLKQYQDAAADITEVLNTQPKNPDALYAKAYLLDQTQDYQRAVTAYTQAIQNCGNDEELKFICLTHRGIVYRELQNFDASYRDFVAAEAIDPNNVFLLDNMALTLKARGQLDEAIKRLRKAVSLDDKYYVGYAKLGFFLSEQMDYPAAIEAFNKALAINPDLAIVYNDRGYAKYVLGKYDKALIDINKSIELLPGNSYAYRNRALVYLKQGETELACRDLKKARELRFQEMFGDEVENLIREHCE